MWLQLYARTPASRCPRAATNLGLHDSRIGLILIHPVISLRSRSDVRLFAPAAEKRWRRRRPVDRGTHFGAFWRVGLPLAVPGIIVPQRYLMRGMTLGSAYG